VPSRGSGQCWNISSSVGLGCERPPCCDKGIERDSSGVVWDLALRSATHLIRNIPWHAAGNAAEKVTWFGLGHTVEISSLKDGGVHREVKIDGKNKRPRSYVCNLHNRPLNQAWERGSIKGGSVYVTPHG
jgi:hypothetical protein